VAKPVLRVIIGSTRPGRIGPSVAEWIIERAREHGGFDVEVTDLAELNLPMYDEPNHPRLKKYVHQHTKDWSALVEGSDAFIFVVPEYNYGFNAATKNAIDYVFNEWAHKAAGIVSYGGVAAGTRATQMLKQVFSALKRRSTSRSCSSTWTRTGGSSRPRRWSRRPRPCSTSSSGGPRRC
jgi:NAD(P)H-dependent FMN reductase